MNIFYMIISRSYSTVNIYFAHGMQLKRALIAKMVI